MFFSCQILQTENDSLKTSARLAAAAGFGVSAPTSSASALSSSSLAVPRDYSLYGGTASHYPFQSSRALNDHPHHHPTVHADAEATDDDDAVPAGDASLWRRAHASVGFPDVPPLSPQRGSSSSSTVFPSIATASAHVMSPSSAYGMLGPRRLSEISRFLEQP